MTLTNETLDRWLEDCKKTPCSDQYWEYYEPGNAVGVFTADGDCKEMLVNECDDRNTARHVVNSQPQNFAALIEELKTLRAEIAELKYDLTPFNDDGTCKHNRGTYDCRCVSCNALYPEEWK